MKKILWKIMRFVIGVMGITAVCSIIWIVGAAGRMLLSSIS